MTIFKDGKINFIQIISDYRDSLYHFKIVKTAAVNKLIVRATNHYHE